MSTPHWVDPDGIPIPLSNEPHFQDIIVSNGVFLLSLYIHPQSLAGLSPNEKFDHLLKYSVITVSLKSGFIGAEYLGSAIGSDLTFALPQKGYHDLTDLTMQDSRFLDIGSLQGIVSVSHVLIEVQDHTGNTRYSLLTSPFDDILTSIMSEIQGIADGPDIWTHQPPNIAEETSTPPPISPSPASYIDGIMRRSNNKSFVSNAVIISNIDNRNLVRFGLPNPGLISKLRIAVSGGRTGGPTPTDAALSMIESNKRKILSPRDLGDVRADSERSFVILRLTESYHVTAESDGGSRDSTRVCVDTSALGEFFVRRFLSDEELELLEPAESDCLDLVVVCLRGLARNGDIDQLLQLAAIDMLSAQLNTTVIGITLSIKHHWSNNGLAAEEPILFILAPGGHGRAIGRHLPGLNEGELSNNILSIGSIELQGSLNLKSFCNQPLFAHHSVPTILEANFVPRGTCMRDVLLLIDPYYLPNTYGIVKMEPRTNENLDRWNVILHYGSGNNAPRRCDSSRVTLQERAITFHPKRKVRSLSVQCTRGTPDNIHLATLLPICPSDIKRSQGDIELTPTGASNSINTPLISPGTVSILTNPLSTKDKNGPVLISNASTIPKHMSPPPPPAPVSAPAAKLSRIIVISTPPHPSPRIADEDGFVRAPQRSDKRRNENRHRTPNQDRQNHTSTGSPLSDMTSSPDLNRPRNGSPGPANKSTSNQAGVNKNLRHSTPSRPIVKSALSRADPTSQHPPNTNHSIPGIINTPITHIPTSPHPTGLNPVRIGPGGTIEYGTLLYNAPYHNFPVEPTIIWNAHPNVIPNPLNHPWPPSPPMLDTSKLPTDFSSSTSLPRSRSNRRSSKNSTRHPRHRALTPSVSDNKGSIHNNAPTHTLTTPSNAPLSTDHGKPKENPKA